MNGHLRRALSLLLLAGLLFILWRAARLGWIAWQTAEAGRQLAAAVQSPAALTAAQAQTAALAARLDLLNREVQPLAPVLHLLADLPGYGPSLSAAPQAVASAAALSPHLDWLLGLDAPRTYLLLVQNNHELRATGGFISAFGRLVLDAGRITDLQFVDSYAVFSLQSEYPPAPQPMQDYMGIQLQVARDANWSPDLPTAAAALLPLYTQDTGVEVDGVLTLDLQAVAHFVAAMPGLRIEGIADPLTPENLETTLIGLWDEPLETETGSRTGGATSEGDWWSRRKDFIAQVAEAMLKRLAAPAGGSGDSAALLAAVWAAFQDRSLQWWVEEPAAQAALAELGWDGSLRPPPAGDYLAIVDSNLGYNKVNAVVKRSLDYRVDWSHGGGQVTLTLTYTHPITQDVSVCDPDPGYGGRYSDLFGRCYFDYIRVYAPAGSELDHIQGVTPGSESSMAAEKGLQQFAGFMVLPPNRTQTITFVYTLPSPITEQAYRLRIQRQSGTSPLPITVAASGKTAEAVIAGNEWDWEPLGAAWP